MTVYPAGSQILCNRCNAKVLELLVDKRKGDQLYPEDVLQVSTGRELNGYFPVVCGECGHKMNSFDNILPAYE